MTDLYPGFWRLGSRKRAVLVALRAWTLETGRPPSRTELCAELVDYPWADTSAVGVVLASLIKSGHVYDAGSAHYVLRLTEHDERVRYTAHVDDP